MAQYINEYNPYDTNKHHTTVISSNVTRGVWGFEQSINLIAEGVDDNQRIGQRIRVKSIQLRGCATFISKSRYNSGLLHLWVLVDRGCDGNLRSEGDIFDNNNADICFPLDDEKYKFVCLKRICVPLTNKASIAGGSDPQYPTNPIDLLRISAFSASKRTHQFDPHQHT